MTEQDDNNWFGSWLTAAKEKSTKVLEFVKKDLEEFGNAVKNEASSVVSSTGNVIEKTLKLDSPESTASTVKRSFSSFLGQMNTVLNPTPDDSDTEAILIGEDSEAITLTKLQRAVYELQKNAETFVKDPDDGLERKFQCWLEIVDDQLSEDRINKHLQSSAVLRRQYEKLVPELVPHALFWKRYLFKKALVEDEIAHQEDMEKKEKKKQIATADEENVGLKWEHEEFAPYIELTEEEQIKLLEEYESEIKQTKPKQTVPRDNGDSPEKNKTNKDADSDELIVSLAETPSSTASSSSSSMDEDWEKIGEVDK